MAKVTRTFEALNRRWFPGETIPDRLIDPEWVRDGFVEAPTGSTVETATQAPGERRSTPIRESR